MKGLLTQMTEETILQLARMLVVLALVVIAAALATPKGRIPLALRGVLRVLKKDRNLKDDETPKVAPMWKRLVAFLLVLVALALAVL